MSKALYQTKAGWTPVRNGPIYCSPRCGFHCTWAEFQAATHEGEALCRRLGEGWTARIWENGRWHYSAEKGHCSVHPSIDWRKEGTVNGREGIPTIHGYTAYFNVPGKQFLGEHDTDPLEAVREALEEAQNYIVKVESAIGELLL